MYKYLKTLPLVLLHIYPEVEWLEHMVILLISRQAATLSFTVEVPLYISTKSAAVTISPYPHQYMLFSSTVILTIVALLMDVK